MTVSARLQESGRESADEDGYMVRFEVRDTGIGLTTSEQEKLFL